MSREGALSRFFDFKVVPNGVLLDEDGTIRWAKFGGFSIDNRDDAAFGAWVGLLHEDGFRSAVVVAWGAEFALRRRAI